jgi:hypothetical protein
MNSNNVNHRYAATVHARYLTTIQDLAKGGSTGRYEEIITCVARMKALATSNGWGFETHLVFFHGGTGDNVTTTYKAKLLLLASNFRADVATYTSQTNIYLFTSQQRVAGTPDYAMQQYDACLTDNKIIMCLPNYNLNTTYGAGDGLHYTNHGERYAAVHYARAIYRKVFVGTYRPLELDIASLTYNSSTKVITIPILNGIGTINKSTNCGIELYSSTISAVVTTTCAVSGTNLQITITAPQGLIGSHNLLVRTGIPANGKVWDSSNATDTSIFNDGSAIPYNLDKYMVAAEYAATYFFPVTAIMAFGGDGNTLSNPKPTTPTNYFFIWSDNVKVTTTVDRVIQGNVIFSELNTATNFWGFAGATQSTGVNTVTGTNLYDNNLLKSYKFIENTNVDNKLKGLNPAKTYTVNVIAIRTNTGTTRIDIITINGNSITKTVSTAATDAVLTNTNQLFIFTGIAPNGSGEITFNVNQNSTQFGYLCGIEIIEE